MQRRSYDYAPRQEYGWGTTTSHDYHSHIANIERMPSALNETPHYPSVHKVFKNKYTYGEESNETQQEQPQKKTSPKSLKKVQMSEHVEIVDSGNGNDKSEVQETKGVDDLADGFIKQKRKGFELCKWKTFRLH
ncbi:hypothetical protein Q3G72_035619 [Acer saccharum]|nr:hypothetical protein Q3G72_035619 [Acer saccharum]